MNLISILLAAFGIGLLIFVHELGHFLAARLAGVHVERFSLGFGPRLCGFRWRGTEFMLAVVPFGGYVMAAGADPNDHRYPPEVSLHSKSLPLRALFWSGGVMMNVLFALVVFPIVFHFGVKVPAPQVGVVVHGGPAWEVGIRPGDVLLALEGRPVRSFENFRIEVALNGQRPLQVRVRHTDGVEETLTLEPRFDREDGLYQVGVREAYDTEVTVADKGPALQAGLRAGEHPARIDGIPVDQPARLFEVLASGRALPVEVLRDGAPVSLTVAPVAGEPDPTPRIGVLPLARRVQGLRRGSALLARLGLERQDVILAIDGRPFLGGDLAAYATGPATLRLLLVRAGEQVVLEQTVTAAERAALADDVALEPDESMRVQVLADRPGVEAGLRSGDLVTMVDGQPVQRWSELQRVVSRCAGRPMRFEVRRNAAEAAPSFDPVAADLAGAETLELTIRPRREPVYDYGLSAISTIVQTEIKATGFADALRLGAVSSVDLVKQAYVMLKRMITGDVGANNLGGIVRISEFSYRAAERGPIWFWYFLALISLNLAFVNLLPIPVLDGGHLVFLLIERVKGSPVSERVFGYSQLVGLVFVLLLVLFVTYNDIMRYL